MTKAVNYKCLIDAVKVLDETRESRYSSACPRKSLASCHSVWNFDFDLTGMVTEKLQTMRDNNSKM